MSDPCDVLVIGAGPTGLAHALWLARAGLNVRIIDKAVQPGTTSRAVGVAARTLELYRQLGIADEVVAEGWKTPAVNFWVRGAHVGHVDMHDIGAGLSPYPFELMYPQGSHERLLIRALEAAGVKVDRPLALVGLVQDEAGVTATLDDGSRCRASYVAGCDGAHSIVRELLAIGLPGGTYERLFFVTDIDATGDVMDGALHVSLDTSRFLAAFPLAVGRARIVGTTDAAAKTWDDVKADVAEHLKLAVTNVRDFSTYHVHHRVAVTFRDRRVFLLGDAAHLHSPVGAQGMNTGIGDAFNLAWKIVDVVRGASPQLLDSFEVERRAFATKLVHTTDRIFQLATKEGGVAEFVRTRLVPHAIHAVLGLQLTRRTAFRMLSQLAIEYRANHTGHLGDVHAGDRLPWVTDLDNFAPLASRAWQVHCYGEAVAHDTYPVHVFAHTAGAQAAGIERDAVFVVRPDGYIAWAGDRKRYLAQ